MSRMAKVSVVLAVLAALFVPAPAPAAPVTCTAAAQVTLPTQVQTPPECAIERSNATCDFACFQRTWSGKVTVVGNGLVGAEITIAGLGVGGPFSPPVSSTARCGFNVTICTASVSVTITEGCVSSCTPFAGPPAIKTTCRWQGLAATTVSLQCELNTPE